ncbi:MAG: GNAT family N-acetyltransferase [Oscillatoriales cyanobacterium]|nr:MAG: GNAT family N-acetyltransferase [Oscillatoriales cyanobacterium]
MFEVQLVDGANKALVTGLLMPLTEKHLDDVATFWKPRLSPRDVDSDWDWVFKKRIYNIRTQQLENWAIEYEGITQGVIMLDLSGRRSRLERDARMVYIFCVATAPWNRMEIQQPPKLQAVGRQLVQFARSKSLDLGFGGRVGLHALPEVEEFYRCLNMTEIPGCSDDSESEIEQLTYFEWRAISRSMIQLNKY